MQFKIFFLSLSKDERKEFASSVGSTVGHLQNVMYGKTCAPALASLIEKESAKRGEHQTVERWHLRPKDWHVIWADLVDVPGAPKLPKRRKQSIGRPVLDSASKSHQQSPEKVA